MTRADHRGDCGVRGSLKSLGHGLTRGDAKLVADFPNRRVGGYVANFPRNPPQPICDSSHLFRLSATLLTSGSGQNISFLASLLNPVAPAL